MPKPARRPPPLPAALRARAEPLPEPDDVLRGRLLGHLGVLGIGDLSADDLDAHLTWALQHHPSHTQVLERVLGQAAARRRERCGERRIRDSGITVRHTLEAFDWNPALLERRARPRVVETVAQHQRLAMSQPLLKFQVAASSPPR